MSDTLLRKNLIRLAHANPELRPNLMPVLKQAATLQVPPNETLLSVMAEYLAQISELASQALRQEWPEAGSVLPHVTNQRSGHYSGTSFKIFDDHSHSGIHGSLWFSGRDGSLRVGVSGSYLRTKWRPAQIALSFSSISHLSVQELADLVSRHLEKMLPDGEDARYV